MTVVTSGRVGLRVGWQEWVEGMQVCADDSFSAVPPAGESARVQDYAEDGLAQGGGS